MSDSQAVVDRPDRLLAASELPRMLIDMGLLRSLRWLPQNYPAGDGHGVLVIPGFLGDDKYNSMLIGFLSGLGYRAVGWGQGRNLGPRDDVLDGLSARLAELVETTQGKVSIIGHSLGGIYAREIARDSPEFVRQVISLGSPINDDGSSSTLTARLYRRLNGVPVKSRGELAAAPPVAATAVYTRADGIVPWRQALQYDGHYRCENIEVLGSHSGLTCNYAVNHILADRLAHSEENWRSFRRNENRKFYLPDNLSDLQSLGLSA